MVCVMTCCILGILVRTVCRIVRLTLLSELRPDDGSPLSRIRTVFLLTAGTKAPLTLVYVSLVSVSVMFVVMKVTCGCVSIVLSVGVHKMDR